MVREAAQFIIYLEATRPLHSMHECEVLRVKTSKEKRGIIPIYIPVSETGTRQAKVY